MALAQFNERENPTGYGIFRFKFNEIRSSIFRILKMSSFSLVSMQPLANLVGARSGTEQPEPNVTEQFMALFTGGVEPKERAKRMLKTDAIKGLVEITAAPLRREFLCAMEGELCNCVGKVYYGHGRRELGIPQLADVKLHRRTEVNAYGTVSCDNVNLCQDPAAPGYEFHKKVCYCDGWGIDGNPSSYTYKEERVCCCNKNTGLCRDAWLGGCGMWDHMVRKKTRSLCEDSSKESAGLFV